MTVEQFIKQLSECPQHYLVNVQGLRYGANGNVLVIPSGTRDWGRR